MTRVFLSARAVAEVDLTSAAIREQTKVEDIVPTLSWDDNSAGWIGFHWNKEVETWEEFKERAGPPTWVNPPGFGLGAFERNNVIVGPRVRAEGIDLLVLLPPDAKDLPEVHIDFDGKDFFIEK